MSVDNDVVGPEIQEAVQLFARECGLNLEATSPEELLECIEAEIENNNRLTASVEAVNDVNSDDPSIPGEDPNWSEACFNPESLCALRNTLCPAFATAAAGPESESPAPQLTVDNTAVPTPQNNAG